LVEVRLLSVRSVSQDNRRKIITSIDGISKFDPEQRLNITKKLIMSGHASKIRRIFILKPNGRMRPSAISTIEDRAKQMLVKLVLKPEKEARFKVNFYGFKSYYSTADTFISRKY
jgi:RNA-directed DNA polymerase